MIFMNYKCRPVALDLEQTIDVRAGVANACRGALPILWIKFLLGNIYLMHWDQKLKYSSAVTKQPNVDAKLSPCYLLGESTYNTLG